MQIHLTAEEKAHCYAFIGGISNIPMLNRHTRRKLVKLAKKFEINHRGPTTLTQSLLQQFVSILDSAVVNGEKALNNPATTSEQKEKIVQVNEVFNGILKKVLPKSEKGVIHVGEVLGTPTGLANVPAPEVQTVSTEIPNGIN
jgi:hypothetical protein